MTTMDFVLPRSLEASEPPEARGLARDGVRLLVGRRGTGEVAHHAFTDLPEILRPGDILVVNTSETLPAAVPVAGADLTVHFSTELTGGMWLVELRRPHAKTTKPYDMAQPGQRYELRGGGAVTLWEPYSEGRLWSAHVYIGPQHKPHGGPELGPHLGSGPGAIEHGLIEYLRRHGEPIRYGYVTKPWPLRFYQTVFAREPGSAEMPSAGRPFTDRLVTRLVTAGVMVVPVLLHTGVASPEAHERPYPEWFAVTEPTARIVNGVRAAGGRVIAVGTTVVRALESATDEGGLVRPARGHTDLVITPEHGDVRAVDGLVTGFHEPQASHLDLLAAIAGRCLLDACYTEAMAAGYLWHEFGDLNLLLP